MSRDRITQIRIRGLRVIEDLTLDLDGLTVLIGDNGSGKSTILDAFEILRLAAKPGLKFIPDVLHGLFGPIESLFRYGASELELGVIIKGPGQELDYSFVVRLIGSRNAEIVRESLTSCLSKGAVPFPVLSRENGKASVFGGGPAHSSTQNSFENAKGGEFRIEAGALALSSVGPFEPRAFERVREALSRVEYHVPFETRPIWLKRALGQNSQGPRMPAELASTSGVERLGANLANCYQELRNRGGETWERVIDRAQLALGRELRDFVLVSSGRGQIALEARFSHLPDRTVPVEVFSEGQISFLLLIALAELDDQRSVLVFDEPEVHLHPALLANALYLFERAAQSCPVLLATHSDRLLDALEDPAKSVGLCELDERNATRLLHLDRSQLDRWLESYRGLGNLRAEGYEAAVFNSPQAAPKGRK